MSEGIKLNLVIVQNHGFASIGALSESLGSQRFGTNYRYRDPATGMLTGDKLPVDLAANAESLGAQVIRVQDHRGVPGRDRHRPRRRADHRHPHRDRPARPRTQLRELVGRAGERGLRARLHPASAQGLRDPQARPEAPDRRQHSREDRQPLDRREARHRHVARGRARCGTRPPASSRPRCCWRPTADVDDAVQTAAAAFESWSQSSLSMRTKVLFAFRELVNARTKELAEIISDEHGKVLSDAAGEVQRGLEVVEFACGIPTLLKGDFSDQVSTGVDLFSFRQPLGVCAGITPFNFPAMVPMWMYPVAIATGNTFVLKPSRARPLGLAVRGRAVGRGGPARRRVQRGARRQGSRRRAAHPPRTSPRSRSSAPPRSPSTSTRPGWPTASACRPSAAPRTTPSCCPTRASTTPPTTSSPRRSARRASAAWRSPPPSPWAARPTTLVAAVSEKARATKVGPGRDAGLRDGPGHHRRRARPDRRAHRHRRRAGRRPRRRRPRPRPWRATRTASSSAPP